MRDLWYGSLAFRLCVVIAVMAAVLGLLFALHPNPAITGIVGAVIGTWSIARTNRRKNRRRPKNDEDFLKDST